MWRYLLPGVLFVALLALFFGGLGLNPSQIQSPLIGKPAPAFDLESLHAPEERIGNDDLTGKVVLLNVWATWCAGCRQEHDTLLAIARSGDVPIVGLNWNDERDKALRWLDQLGNPYVATAFDPEGRVAIDWGVYGAPETFLLDASGTVRYKHIGPLDWQTWQTTLLPLVRAAAEPRS